MVFAANANESSANTFEAFQEHAKQTGTGSNSNSSSTSTTGKNGAGAVRLGGTGMIAVGLVALGLTL